MYPRKWIAATLTLFIELLHIIQQVKLLYPFHKVSPAAMVASPLLLHAHIIEEVGASKELLIGESRICAAARWARGKVGVERTQPLLLLTVVLQHLLSAALTRVANFGTINVLWETTAVIELLAAGFTKGLPLCVRYS